MLVSRSVDRYFPRVPTDSDADIPHSGCMALVSHVNTVWYLMSPSAPKLYYLGMGSLLIRPSIIHY
jgi:hypothetical protein